MYLHLSRCKGSIDMRGIRLIRKYVSFGRLACFCMLDALFCVALLGIALFLSTLLDTVTAAVASGNFWPVVYLTVASFVYALVLGVLKFASGALKTLIVKSAMIGLRENAAREMMMAGVCGRATNSSEQLTILGQNMDILENDCVMGLLDILESAFKIVVGCVMLVLINPLIALVSLVGMAMPTLVPHLFGKRLSDQQRQMVSDATAYNRHVRDAAQGAEVIRSFHVEENILGKMNGATEQYQGRKAILGVTMACVGSVSSVVGVIMQFAIMGMTGMFAVWGYVSIGSIVAVTQLSGSVISPATELSGKIGKLKATYPLLDRLYELKRSAEIGQVDARHEVRHFIELDNVSFSYGDAGGTQDGSASMPRLLRNCSWRFDAGGKFAVVGKSGCGKSTMLELLGGRLRPSSGKVLVDGKPYLVPDAAWVHQNIFLFDDTLRENITLGGSFTDKQVKDAVHLAGLDNVVASLPDGLGTEVNEGGARFSGGECQRVAIARALLYGKTTLLVDEATSALDSETAACVEDTLLSLDGVTLIAVTHHLDSEHAAQYDEVLEMSDGDLVPLDQVA